METRTSAEGGGEGSMADAAQCTRLVVTNDLIALERGDEELLLVNSFHLCPLYVKRGRKRVQQILAAAGAGRTPEQLAAEFPGEAALVGQLVDHGILVEADVKVGRVKGTVPFSPTMLRTVPGKLGQSPAADTRRKNRVTLYLLVSERCNLQCVYCLAGPKTYHSPAGMTAEVAFRSLDMALNEASPGGSVEVAFFGGEPLLQWPLVKQVIRHCEDHLRPAHPEKQIHYHLTSNLTLAPPDLAEWVARHDISVVCEVDGPAEIHDRCRPCRGGGPSHAATVETIHRLVQAAARVTLRATITAANHDRLPEVAAHHTALGAVSSLFVPVRPVNSDQEFFPQEILPDADKIIAAARALRRDKGPGKANLFPFNDFSAEICPGVRHVVACGAPYGTTYVVRPNGDVYPCIYLVGQPSYLLGNVAGTLDHRPLAEMFQTWHVDRREECRACVWRYACGGGCPVMNLARIEGLKDRPAVADYVRKITCGLSQAILADALWELADAKGI